MATFSTDFSEYTTSSAPGDWTQRWGNYAAKFTIEADGAALGGKILALDGTSNSAASWDDLDSDADRDDAEILMKCRCVALSGSTEPNIGALLRADGGRNGYYAGIYSTTAIRLRKVISSTSSAIVAQTGRTFAVDTWYWIRFRANGTALQVRVWPDGDSEPGTWDIDTTDSDITAAGWVGVFSNGTTTEPDVDYFSVGTNGDTAPSPGGGGGGSAPKRALLLGVG
jgi:hypothetical protein